MEQSIAVGNTNNFKRIMLEGKLNEGNEIRDKLKWNFCAMRSLSLILYAYALQMAFEVVAVFITFFGNVLHETPRVPFCKTGIFALS